MTKDHEVVIKAQTGTNAIVTHCANGDAQLDPLQLRRAFGKFTTGVTIVATMSNEQPEAMTCNSFSSVSLDPPLLLWSLRKASYSYDKFANSEYFSVSILASNQMELSAKFAKGSPDKFAGIEFVKGHGNSPVFKDATATFECTTETTHDAGDHLIIIGRIVRVTHSERPPLVFSDGRYVDISERPPLRAIDSSTLPENLEDPLHQYVSVLLVRAFHRFFEHLADARAKIGVAANESRLLTVARAYPNRRFEELLPYTYMAESAMIDALNTLQERQYLTVDLQGRVVLTDLGDEKVQAYNRRSKAVEEYLFQEFRGSQIEDFRRILLSIMKSKPLS